MEVQVACKIHGPKKLANLESPKATRGADFRMKLSGKKVTFSSPEKSEVSPSFLPFILKPAEAIVDFRICRGSRKRNLMNNAGQLYMHFRTFRRKNEGKVH